VVRATSVVKKLNKQDVFFDAPFSPAGRALAVTLHRKEWVWSIAWRDYAPHLIAEWAMQVAKDMTNLYHETSILKASDSEQRTRLYLLKNGINAATSALQILGIKVPDKM
jgi:arginyl-tRNA synthetase